MQFNAPCQLQCLLYVRCCGRRVSGCFSPPCSFLPLRSPVSCWSWELSSPYACAAAARVSSFGFAADAWLRAFFQGARLFLPPVCSCAAVSVLLPGMEGAIHGKVFPDPPPTCCLGMWPRVILLLAGWLLPPILHPSSSVSCFSCPAPLFCWLPSGPVCCGPPGLRWASWSLSSWVVVVGPVWAPLAVVAIGPPDSPVRRSRLGCGLSWLSWLLTCCVSAVCGPAAVSGLLWAVGTSAVSGLPACVRLWLGKAGPGVRSRLVWLLLQLLLGCVCLWRRLVWFLCWGLSPSLVLLAAAVPLHLCSVAPPSWWLLHVDHPRVDRCFGSGLLEVFLLYYLAAHFDSP